MHKFLQRRLNKYLQHVYHALKPGCVHGFVRKLTRSSTRINIRSNARVHTGKKYVVNADLQDFFHSITAGRVRDAFMSAPFHFRINLATFIAVFTTWYNRLPMGAPTSPVISNFVMNSLDSKLVGLSGQYDYTYTRYADDLTFSGNIKPDRKFLEGLNKIIESEGFTINKNKFRIQSNKTRQTVTGIVVNEKVNLPRKYYRNLRAILHDWELNGAEVAAMKYFRMNTLPDYPTVYRFEQAIRGKVSYFTYIRGKSDPLAVKLNRKLSKVLHKRFVE